jgi:hypothetical protein
MTDGGRTSRFTFSTSFFWVIGLLTLIVFTALFLSAYKLSALMVDYQSTRQELNALNTYYETREFNQAINESPQEAGIILGKLDQAALLAETLEDEPILPWVVETTAEIGPGSAEVSVSGNNEGDSPAKGEADPAEPLVDTPGDGAGQARGALQVEPAEGAVDPESTNPPAILPDEPKDSAPLSPEAEAWAAFQNRLPEIPEEVILDVDDFRVTPTGAYSYYLKRVTTTGGRLRGRAITIFAVADKDGNVVLVPDPKIDLSVPSQGYDLGGKYNIVSSKVYRGNVKVPQGGKLLSVRVLAWDEATKALIFQKKIAIGGPRAE